ncbi:MAG: hypothetical protein A2268_01860 [Candidatus Raymondbacteria bacterium RifOxyA12_full_50_37]|nr:MAG: hypothetical protein A2268_01860 [Candidatus Raymondbacteria bacterium RifOxyA12_full_50_37]
MPLDPAFPFSAAPHAFSDREIRALHLHPYFEIGLCYSGEGIFVVEDKVIRFKPGDVMLIASCEAHKACSPSGKKCSWRFALTDAAALLRNMTGDARLLDTDALSGPRFPNRFSQENFPAMHTAVAALFAEAVGNKAHAQDLIRSLLLQTLVEAHRYLQAHQPRTAFVRRARDLNTITRLKPALQAIAQGYEEPMAVPGLAHVCAMSEGHFRRQFNAAMGKGPLEYLNDYRISMVCSRIANPDESITSAVTT